MNSKTWIKESQINCCLASVRTFLILYQNALQISRPECTANQSTRMHRFATRGTRVVGVGSRMGSDCEWWVICLFAILLFGIIWRMNAYSFLLCVWLWIIPLVFKNRTRIYCDMLSVTSYIYFLKLETARHDILHLLYFKTADLRYLRVLEWSKHTPLRLKKGYFPSCELQNTKWRNSD